MSGKNSKRHVQLPNNMIDHNDMEPKDLLIYTIIKKYMNNETKECFPSLSTISKDSGYSINTIRNSISLLLKEGYISIRKEGKKQIYKFNPYKSFEVFSYEFLESDILEANERAYVLAYQQFLIKDQEGFGKTSFTDEVVSEKLNLSVRTISRLDQSLMRKGLLNVVKTDKKDPETGVFIKEKFFHLDELGQAIIWTLQKHEEDIEGLKETTKSNTRDIDILIKGMTEKDKEIEELKRRLRKLETGEEDPTNITL